MFIFGYIKEYCDYFVGVIQMIWEEFGIKWMSEWVVEGGFIGVGELNVVVEELLWMDEQFGIVEVVRMIEQEVKVMMIWGGLMEWLLEREMEGLQMVSVVV